MRVLTQKPIACFGLTWALTSRNTGADLAADVRPVAFLDIVADGESGEERRAAARVEERGGAEDRLEPAAAVVRPAEAAFALDFMVEPEAAVAPAELHHVVEQETGLEDLRRLDDDADGLLRADLQADDIQQRQPPVLPRNRRSAWRRTSCPLRRCSPCRGGSSRIRKRP